MRIAYVCEAYPPMVNGPAFVVRDLAHGMSQRGHAVLVLTASDTGDAYASADGDLRLSRLASIPNPFRVGQRMVLLRHGDVRRELSAFRPHLVHAHEPLGIGLAAIRHARSSGLPALLTVHQLPWFVAAHLPGIPGLRRTAEELLWRYSGWVVARCDVLIAPTLPIARTVQSRVGRLPEVIGGGVDPVLFASGPGAPDEATALRRQFGLDPSLPIVLHVGRIDPDKRVERVVEAVARVMDETPAQLLLVGDGTRRHAVQALCQELDIADRTHFAGYVPRDRELPRLYRLASAFVNLSIIETQCLAALEALMSGVPVVAVDTPVMREMVQDGVNGFLAPADDLEAVVQRLLELLQNPGRAREMGQAGRRRAKVHSPRRMLDLHEELYRSLLLASQRSQT